MTKTVQARCKELLREGGLTPISVPTAAAAATATATSASRPFFARARFVDGQRTALEVFLVEHRDRLGRIVLGRHFDKGEPTRSPSGAILHNIDRDHCACLCEVILQIVFSCSERQVTNE